MSCLIIRHDLDGLSEKVMQFYHRLDGDLSPVMNLIGNILAESSEKRVREDKTAPDGTPWKDLQPATWAYRVRAKQTGGGILNATGRLLGGMTYEADHTHAIIGTSMLYAWYHQDGTKKMPARPIFGISAQDKEDIKDTLDDWLMEGLK